jgi:RimJ/RimL family protein N-acetyltransferase
VTEIRLLDPGDGSAAKIESVLAGAGFTKSDSMPVMVKKWDGGFPETPEEAGGPRISAQRECDALFAQDESIKGGEGIDRMPHLIGERIVLREYRMDDLPHLRKWANDPEVTDNLSNIFVYPHSVENTQAFLKMMVDGSAESKGFIIAEKDTLDYIGQIDLHRIDWINRNAVLGIVIGRKDMQNRGIGYEAIRLLQRFAFHTLNLHRLELEVYEFNERAIRCYRKAGFREEGRMRQRLYRHGKYWDILMMGILREEFERGVGNDDPGSEGDG